MWNLLLEFSQEKVCVWEKGKMNKHVRKRTTKQVKNENQIRADTRFSSTAESIFFSEKKNENYETTLEKILIGMISTCLLKLRVTSTRNSKCVNSYVTFLTHKLYLSALLVHVSFTTAIF